MKIKLFCVLFILALAMLLYAFEDYVMILQRLYDLIKSNPRYSMMFSKDAICAGYDGKVVQRVYNRIN